MKVSVIITNYNYGLYVGDAIESVLRQTYRDIEIIVVDDGSSDDSLNVVAAYPDVKLIQTSHVGQGGAINAGFLASSGAIIFMLDADDVLEHTIIERVVESYSQNNTYVKFHYQLQVMDAKGDTIKSNNSGVYAAFVGRYCACRY